MALVGERCGEGQSQCAELGFKFRDVKVRALSLGKAVAKVTNVRWEIGGLRAVHVQVEDGLR